MSISRAVRSFLLGLLIITSVALLILILSDGLPQLRGPAPESSEWYWPYLIRPLQRWWPALLAALLTWSVAVWWLRPQRATRWRHVLALAGMVLATLSLQLAIIYADRANVPADLVDRTLSNLASGFFEPAAELESLDIALRSYPALMSQFTSEHARTHPPGLVAANWATIRAMSAFPQISSRLAQIVHPLRCTDLWLLDRPPEVAAALGIWSILPLLAASLTILPGFLLAKTMLTGRTVRLAAILTATLPALLLFAPKSVQFYAPLALLLTWLFHTGLLRHSYSRLLAAGLLLSLLSMLSLGNAALLLLLSIYAILLLWLPGKATKLQTMWPQSWTELLGQTLIFALGAASLWLLLWAGWGVPPWAIAAEGLAQHYGLVTNLRRYEWWVGWNLLDLLLFSGWPLFLGFAGSLFLAWRTWRRGAATAVDLLATALLLFIVILDLSGSARGETGRLWLFFMPLLALPSARWWQRILPGRGTAALLVGLQLLFVLALGLAWQPVRPVIVVAEKPVQLPATPQVELAARFVSEPLTLSGATVSQRTAPPGSTVSVTLFWRADGPASRPYTVFNHLSDVNGVLVSQADGWPVNGTWPPTCWRGGDLIVDPFHLALPAGLLPGTYDLKSGLYDARDGRRLLLESGDDGVDLGQIRVIETP